MASPVFQPSLIAVTSCCDRWAVMEPSGLLLIVAPVVFRSRMELGVDPVHLGIINGGEPWRSA